jgi:hypothetical protein
VYPYDSESHLQLARERAAELARDYDRARKAERASRAPSRRRRSPALAFFRALRPSRRPAYRS